MRPKQPIASPVAIDGSHCLRCSSVPCRWIANIASEPCTDTRLRSPLSHGLQLLAHQPVGGGRRSPAAVPLQVHAEQSQLAQVGGQLAGGHVAGLEPLGDMRAQALLAEPANGVAQLDLFGRQQRVDVEQVFNPGGGTHAPCLHRRGLTKGAVSTSR